MSRLPVLVGFVVLALAGSFAVWALQEPGPDSEAAPDPDPGVEAAAGALDVEPPIMPDGEPFPPGTTREGARTLVTPDGERFVRRRDGSGWRRERSRVAVVPPTPVSRAPPPPPAPPTKPDAPKVTVRPPNWNGSGSSSDRPRFDGKWPERNGTFSNSGAAAPRLDVSVGGEAALGSGVRTIEDQDVAFERERTGEEEERHVVLRHGLRGDYYDFLEGNLWEIPELASLPPTFSRIDLTVDFTKDEEFDLPFPPETFATLWRGFLNVPEDGRYRFTIGSDDGVRMTIGEDVVIEHAGLRAYGESDGRITLATGQHPIEIVFYENEVFASCRVFWEGPSWKSRVIPAEAFSPPTEIEDFVQPHVTRTEPTFARVGDEITLLGVGFADQPALNRVTFAGVPAEVIEAETGRLLVRVPIGAETSDIVVQVGPLSSLPRAFEIDSVLGLFAEYYLIGEDLSVMPEFDERVPYFVRLDGPVDFHQDHLWGLPHEPDVFALRYSGYLYVPEADDYHISIVSDDGMELWLDGESFLADRGLHAPREVSRTAYFEAGFHPLKLQFFENRGIARLRLFWQRPHEPTRTPIPRGFLFPPEDVATSVIPHIETRRVTGEIGEVITLEGEGFGNDVSRVRVLFPGDVWVRPTSVAETHLTTRVPRAAGTGSLQVDVGIRSSNAVRFERASPMGLTADYYLFASAEELKANATPEKLRERTPNVTRVETLFDRTKPEHWDVSFPLTNFAVHLHGTLDVEYATRIGWLLQADDGGYLYVDDHLAVDCRPFHRLLERGGNSHLTPGAHRVDLYLFQQAGDAGLRLFWNPFGIAEHRDVPARWFRPDAP